MHPYLLFVLVTFRCDVFFRTFSSGLVSWPQAFFLSRNKEIFFHSCVAFKCFFQVCHCAFNISAPMNARNHKQKKCLIPSTQHIYLSTSVCCCILCVWTLENLSASFVEGAFL